MFSRSFFILALSFVSVKTNTDAPLEKFIKLSVGVSKATYLPAIADRRFIRNGHIIENPSMASHAKKNPFSKYKPSEERISCSVGGWNGKGYEVKDTEVLLFTHPQQKLAVFGFRGTETSNLNDWMKNFKMGLAKANVGSTKFKIHEGFRNRYRDISSWLESEYDAIPEDYTIILTGHSLGGALATISAVYASGKLNRRPDAVITFASPLVGDQDFSDYYVEMVGCDRTLRIATKDDVVVKFPPKALGYTHVCNVFEVNGNVSGFLSNLNFVATHDLYGDYDRGLTRKYADVNEINLACDRLL